MFSRIQFLFDREGQPYPAPVEVTLKHVRGKSFSLYSDEYRSEFGEFPALQVTREPRDLATDPWNEDGRPPSVMFILACPTVKFYGRFIEVVGFEHGNMLWAGLVRAAYDGCPPLKGLPKDRVWDKRAAGECPYDFQQLHRQVVRLCV